MRYDTILFDADGTLFDFDEAERCALTAVLKANGLPARADLLARYHTINQALWKEFELGDITREALQRERFARLLDLLPDGGIDPDRFNQAYREQLGQNGQLLPDALEVCRSLSGEARLYLVTNGLKLSQHGRFRHSPIRPCFSGIFTSEEVGCPKPRREFFDAVLQAIAPADPARILVVGDSLTSDIRGGNNAGLDTCWLNPAGEACPAGIFPTYTVARLPEVLPLARGTARADT